MHDGKRRNELRAGTTLAFWRAAGFPFPVEAHMKTSIIAGSLLTALTLTVPLQAQQVAADVVLPGPVAGHVLIGNGYSAYRRPVVYRAPARVTSFSRAGLFARQVILLAPIAGYFVLCATDLRLDDGIEKHLPLCRSSPAALPRRDLGGLEESLLHARHAGERRVGDGAESEVGRAGTTTQDYLLGAVGGAAAGYGPRPTPFE